MKKKVFRDLAFHQLIEHPAPWKIEHDWTIEVHSSDGHIVAKTSSMQNAIDLCEWANRETEKMDKFIKEIDKELEK